MERSAGSAPEARIGLPRKKQIHISRPLPRVKRSLWFLGEVPSSFEKAAAFIQSLAEEAPQYRLVMMSSDPQTQNWLRERFVDDEVLPFPGNSGAVARRYFRRLRPALIMTLDPGGSKPASIHEHAVSNSVPMVALPSGTPVPDGHNFLARLVKPAPYEHPVNQAWRVPTWRDRAGQSRLWKSFAPYFNRRRIDDWDALGLRLGNPQSILCLGNGPSSEDLKLANLDYDCLMRVNWRWKLRGFLTDPDVVFVGDASTFHRLPPRVFGLWNIWLEYAMLLRHFITHGPRRMEYFTMERISPLIRDRFWRARPSNGPLMVAAAVALRPKRLTIAGIDLFRHPEGRYPGDTVSLNEYSRVHTREVDVAIIDLALRDFPGELVIFGDTLRQALEDIRTRNASSICSSGENRPAAQRP